MEDRVHVRPMVDGDLDEADRITRLAFATFRGLPEQAVALDDTEAVRTRFVAAPDCAWVAEIGGDVVGSVLAARWGSFGFFGPLTVHPDLWDRGVGSRLLEPVLAAFEAWQVRQAGLFTFSSSPKHLGLYQKHGFWPGYLVAVLGKQVAPAESPYTLFSQALPEHQARLLDEIRALTDTVFPGLDLEREIVARRRTGDRRHGSRPERRFAHRDGGVPLRTRERGRERSLLRQVRSSSLRRDRGRRVRSAAERL